MNSDPTHQSDKKSIEFSISYLLHDVQSNHSYSIDDNSSCDAHPDCYLSIDKQDIPDYSSQSRLPYSSLLWPRKGQTLDHYIRECDSQTLTDLEKVRFENHLMLFSFF